jgi:hypothetical protein
MCMYLQFPVARSSSSFRPSGPSDGAASAGVTECSVESRFCRLMLSSSDSPSNSLTYIDQSLVWEADGHSACQEIPPLFIVLSNSNWPLSKAEGPDLQFRSTLRQRSEFVGNNRCHLSITCQGHLLVRGKVGTWPTWHKCHWRWMMRWSILQGSAHECFCVCVELNLIRSTFAYKTPLSSGLL